MIINSAATKLFTANKPTHQCVVLGTVVSDVKVQVNRESLLPGATVICDDPRWSLGGNAGRCSAILAALGVDVTLIGDVGSDLPGRRIVEQLQKLSVNVDSVQKHGDYATSSTTALVGEDGERTLIHNYGANACLDISALDRMKRVLKAGDVFMICGARLLPGLSFNDVGSFFDYAREVGAISVYDTTKRPEGSLADDLGPVLSSVDVFCTSMGEAQEDWAASDAHQVTQHLSKLCKGSVVVKDGGEGAWFAVKNKNVGHCVAPRVEVIDTTGAGDSFMAGLLYGLACNQTLGDAVCGGVAVGSLSVSQSHDVCDGVSIERLQMMAGSMTCEAVD